MTSTPARILFAGSPEFAVPTLERLARSPHHVVAVLTQPDRPAGRGQHLQANPIKRCAVAHGIEVLQPESLKRDELAREQIRDRAVDLMVVVAYGLILPPAVLGMPRHGCINIHASLLPRWRGAAPIQAALLAGDAQTGVAIMRLEEGLDTGPVAASRAIDIGAAETAGELHDRLAPLGAELLMESLDAILDGRATFVPQAATGATYAPKLSKAAAVIDWTEPAAVLDRRIRAYNPWPVAETRIDGRQLRCWLAQDVHEAGSGAPPGTVVAAGAEGIDVQTGAGVLRLLAVQLAGRNPLPAAEFARGHAATGRLLGA